MDCIRILFFVGICLILGSRSCIGQKSPLQTCNVTQVFGPCLDIVTNSQGSPNQYCCTALKRVTEIGETSNDRRACYKSFKRELKHDQQINFRFILKKCKKRKLSVTCKEISKNYKPCLHKSIKGMYKCCAGYKKIVEMTQTWDDNVICKCLGMKPRTFGNLLKEYNDLNQNCGVDLKIPENFNCTSIS